MGHDGNPDYLNKGKRIINYEKMQLLGSLVKKIQQDQHYHIEINFNPNVYQFLHDLQFLSSEELDTYSTWVKSMDEYEDRPITPTSPPRDKPSEPDVPAGSPKGVSKQEDDVEDAKDKGELYSDDEYNSDKESPRRPKTPKTPPGGSSIGRQMPLPSKRPPSVPRIDLTQAAAVKTPPKRNILD